MRHMANCLKAIWKGNESFLSLMLISKPLKDLLILIVFIVKLDLSLLYRHLSSIFLGNIFQFELLIHENSLLLRVIGNDTLVVQYFEDLCILFKEFMEVVNIIIACLEPSYFPCLFK